MRRGFTLLELIVVIIIIGILATLGFTQYTKVVEKGRTAEAKAILGSMRTAWQAYYLEYRIEDAVMDDLAVDAPRTCTSTHYFVYSTSGTTGTATRCLAGEGGKIPAGPSSGYYISIKYVDGTLEGTPGYY